MAIIGGVVITAARREHVLDDEGMFLEPDRIEVAKGASVGAGDTAVLKAVMEEVVLIVAEPKGGAFMVAVVAGQAKVRMRIEEGPLGELGYMIRHGPDVTSVVEARKAVGEGEDGVPEGVLILKTAPIVEPGGNEEATEGRIPKIK